MTLPALTAGHAAASSASLTPAALGNLSLPLVSSAATPQAACTHPPTRNRLLGALPPVEIEQLEPYLERLTLEPRQILFESDAPIRHVYFPDTAIVSLVSRLSDGATIEVGTAGREGMVGLPLFLGSASSSTCAFVQIPGTAMRMDADAFQRVTAETGFFHRILLRYTQAFLTQVAQTAACNGAHLVEQRCARWLLMSRDRVDADEFPLTHEFLALMLCVRRPGVTVAMRALQDRGLVRYTRGRVEIVDRKGLEKSSCGCYGVVRTHFARLLPQQILS